MSVNDILVQGAERCSFSTISPAASWTWIGYEVIKGIALGCEQSGCALIGRKLPRCPHVSGRNMTSPICGRRSRKSGYYYGSDIKPGDVVLGLGFQRCAFQWLFAGAQNY